MRIVIIGGSRLGVALAERLAEGSHDVVLVDRSREKLDELSERLDCGFIEGDGTLPQILRDAYGDGADALMPMTNHDDVNILSAVVGRSIGFERIVLQIVRAQLLDICEELGLEDVVTPHVTVAGSIVQSLENDERVWSELSAVEGVQFTTYAVPDELVGRNLSELELPEVARAVAITREGKEATVNPATEMRAGDHILVAATEDVRKELQQIFEV
jgi:trk system potassium uptake protein TrkA